jgi:hypothetical protein
MMYNHFTGTDVQTQAPASALVGSVTLVLLDVL